LAIACNASGWRRVGIAVSENGLRRAPRFTRGAVAWVARDGLSPCSAEASATPDGGRWPAAEAVAVDHLTVKRAPWSLHWLIGCENEAEV
jgi:hypothetical protein